MPTLVVAQILAQGAAIRSQALRDKADRFAANILPVIHALQTEGITSYKAIARAFNARGVRTANQRQWHPTTVRNLRQRTSGVKRGYPATKVE